MIKNELIKFFTSLKIWIYGGIIFTFILINDVIFVDKPCEIATFHNFLYDNVKSLVFVIPIILAPIVSEIFTYDYECGCMKFFVIYKRREKILFYKILSSIIITSILIIFTFVILTMVYIIENPGEINTLKYQAFSAMKIMIMFLIALIPVILIYVLISILSKNSAIVSLLVFLLVIMSDFIPKTIGDITPRRFLWSCLLKNRINNLSIVLFLVYIAVLMFINIKVFSKKELIQ
ncbi:hypothetical protein [Clostridium lundense]|uniref:hypothetical protein n=1 Tax=Clostridium lundense TaxID=319475 RepID=UPI00048418CE|nr:hypothetical protein [Clostridium lundense]